MESAKKLLEEIVFRMPHASTACMVQPRDLSVACNNSMTQAQMQAKHEMYQIPLFSVVERAVESLVKANGDFIQSQCDCSEECKKTNPIFSENGNILEEIQESGAKSPKVPANANHACTEGSSEGSPTPAKVKLFAEQCFMMLCMCKPALEEAYKNLLEDFSEPSAEPSVEDSSSHIARMSISKQSVSPQSPEPHACSTGV